MMSERFYGTKFEILDSLEIPFSPRSLRELRLLYQKDCSLSDSWGGSRCRSSRNVAYKPNRLALQMLVRITLQ